MIQSVIDIKAFIGIAVLVAIGFLVAIRSGYAIHLKSSDFELKLDPPNAQAIPPDNPTALNQH